MVSSKTVKPLIAPYPIVTEPISLGMPVKQCSEYLMTPPTHWSSPLVLP
jgi:hypothetical protein